MNLRLFFLEIAFGIAVGAVEFNDVGALSFLHHLIRISLPVLQCDAQGVGARGQLAHVDALESLALRAHQTALEVEELDLLGLNVGGELHEQLVFHGVGIEAVGTNLDTAIVHAHRAVVVEEEVD